MSPTILRMLLELRRGTDLMGESPFSYRRHADRRSRPGDVPLRGSLSRAR
jgi:hypothetical protein